jgi:large conductance mechanosensitive channel
MLNEFKEFIAKGNVMDMAVGIIIGAAFTTVVTSMVGDLIMPVIGVITSGVDFADLFIALDGQSYDGLKAAQDAGAAVFAYGSFINAIVNFLIVGFAVFLLVKGVNKLKREKEAAPAEAGPPKLNKTEELLIEIRDALKKK